MISQMKLLRRGIVLTVVPLLFQMTVVGWLGWQVWHLLTELEQANNSTSLASDVNEIVEQAITSVAKMHMNSDSEDGLIDSATTEKEKRIFIASTDRLRSLKISPDQELPMQQFLSSTQGLIDCLNSIHNHQRQGRAHWRKVDESYYHEVSKRTLAFVETGSIIVSKEEAKLKATPIALDQRYATIANFVWIAFPSSLLLSLVLGLVWLKSIRDPLARVIEDSERLSNRKELLPALNSGDEIGELDRLMHSVSAALAEAHQKENSLLENAADLICSIDEGFIFTKSNSYSQTLLGISATDLVGKTAFDLIVPEDRLKAEEEFRKAQKTADTLALEVRVQRQDGTIVDTSWSILWSELQQNLFCVVHDISEQKKVERLKEDFMNMVSHDLRSPLTAILGSMTLLSEGAKGPISDELQSDVQIAKRNIERLISFVNDLLDFQKLKAGKLEIKPQAVRIDSIVSESVELVARLAEEKEITIDTACGDWVVDVDESRMVQVLVNFLSNAIKFSPVRSKIQIDVERTQDAIEIRVTDNGPGVPEEYRETIFEPFEQVPGAKSREGTGFGLAVCKLIVDAHGARVGVREATGQSGSTFWIALPLK